jgi:3-oxoacyl-[acyl-carrier protein] reductase
MVSSVTGPVKCVRGDSAYATAKAALVSLVRSLAVDLAIGGVTPNAVAPGWIATSSPTGGHGRGRDPDAAWRRGSRARLRGCAPGQRT